MDNQVKDKLITKYNEIKDQEQKTEEDSETDIEKAEYEPSKHMIEEPWDNDGENKNPKEDERTSILQSAVLIGKTMVGSGILNLSFNIKTVGFTGFLLEILLVNFANFLSIYLLMKAKKYTQRHSYAAFSKLALGLPGTILVKGFILLTMALVTGIYLIILGDSFRTVLLLFFKDSIYCSKPVIITAISIIILPFMFSEQITGVKKFASFATINVFIFLGFLITCFVYKIYAGEVVSPNIDMLKPKGTFVEILICFGSIFSAFSFQVSFFPIYLPMKPRNTNSIYKAYFLAAGVVTVLYAITGTIGYFIYGDRLNDSLLIFFREDIIQHIKQKDYFVAVILLLSTISFFVSCTISLPLIFFPSKENFSGLVYLVYKKLFGKKKIEEQELENVDDIGESKNEKKEDKLSSTQKKIFTTILFALIYLSSIFTTKIVFLEEFIGAFAVNYVNFMAPGLFFLIFSRYAKPTMTQNMMSYFSILIGLTLMVQYFYKLTR